jgi:hypothetical protein
VNAIDVSTLDAGDVSVTEGLDVPVTFVGTAPAGNGSPRIATYALTPPGGVWDVADDGTYAVVAQPGQVRDVTGAALDALPVGSFHVGIPLTFTVTTTNDGGPRSLRDAIARANAMTGTADTIAFDPVVFATPRTITLTTGELVVGDSVTVAGPGVDLLTISGNNASRVFRLDGLGILDVAIAGVTLTKGFANVPGNTASNEPGGAINAGNEHLTVSASRLVANKSSGVGGAIFGDLFDSVTVLDSTVSDNQARMTTGRGGGIAASNVTNRRSSVVRNAATQAGGGIFFSGAIVVDSSTIAFNTVFQEGGGVCTAFVATAPVTAMTIVNGTIYGNAAPLYGGGIEIESLSGPFTLRGSTVTANSASATGQASISWASAPLMLRSSLTARSCRATPARRTRTFLCRPARGRFSSPSAPSVSRTR